MDILFLTQNIFFFKAIYNGIFRQSSDLKLYYYPSFHLINIRIILYQKDILSLRVEFPAFLNLI